MPWVRLRQEWRRGLQGPVTLALSALLAFAALWRVPTELRRLVTDPIGAPLTAWGGQDVYFRHEELQRWIDGIFLYDMTSRTPYPPASYPLFWPLLAPADFTLVRWIWAASLLVALCVFAWQLARGAAGSAPGITLVLLLTPFAAYATAATLRLGQLGIHVLALALGAALLLRRPPSWTRDLAAAALFVMAMVKPINAAPFGLLLLAVGGLRPAAIAAGAYAGLTVLSAQRQPVGLVDLLRASLQRSETLPWSDTHGNLWAWLTHAGYPELALPASLVVLALTAAFLFHYRRADLWLLIGVTALVSRMWTYHFHYDDVAVLAALPILARMAGHEENDTRWMAASRGLALALVLSAIMPASLMRARFAWGDEIMMLKTVLWVATLVFLVLAAPRVLARGRPLLS